MSKQITALVDEFRPKFEDIPWITPTEYLEQTTARDWVVVDVRPRQERKVSMIPGAITQDEFEHDIDKYRDRPVITYCTVGYRSGIYTEELRKSGIDAFNLWGGVLAWALAGKTFVTPDGDETRKAHVYGRKWNALPDSYEAVW